MARWRRLGLVAGGGALPIHVAEAAAAEGRLGRVIALKGFADPADFPDAAARGLGEVGGVLEDLRAAGCDAACFAGVVKRPDLRKLDLDWKAAKLLPRALAAAVRGDDALLRFVVSVFEAAGLMVVGVQDIAADLLAPDGALGAHTPSRDHRADIDKARAVIAAMGAFDIGQGAVVCEGLVLAVEAQEGTDAMLARVAGLPEPLRGTPQARRGVLVKAPKPDQERRVDLPVIGVSTVEGAAAAGLAGVAVPAGAALVLGREAVAQAADRVGLFVFGLTPEAGEGGS